jgi:hypothetical protein
MDFIHCRKIKILKSIKKLKSQRFGSWLCFRPQVNGGGEEKNTYSVGPLRQSQPPSLDSQLPKRDFNFLIFSIFYSSDDG